MPHSRKRWKSYLFARRAGAISGIAIGFGAGLLTILRGIDNEYLWNAVAIPFVLAFFTIVSGLGGAAAGSLIGAALDLTTKPHGPQTRT